MGYMKDSEGRRLDGFPVGQRPTVGRLRNIPAATGSQAYYYADDDCGGTAYQDVAAGRWERVAPRGEILSVESPNASAYTVSTSFTAVYGAFMELTTADRPSAVEITVEADMQIGNASTDTAWTTGARYGALRLQKNGVTVRDGYAWASELSTGNVPRPLRFSVRDVLLPNTAYAWTLYYSSQSASPTVNVRTQTYRMKVTEL